MVIKYSTCSYLKPGCQLQTHLFSTEDYFYLPKKIICRCSVYFKLLKCKFESLLLRTNLVSSVHQYNDIHSNNKLLLVLSYNYVFPGHVIMFFHVPAMSFHTFTIFSKFALPLSTLIYECNYSSLTSIVFKIFLLIF